jgi:acetoin utilization deacetylase AcuC-like enzyme
MSVRLLTDAAMDAHAAPGHPERPERRDAAAAGVRDAAGAQLEEPPVEPIDRATLEVIHDPAYLSLLDDAEARGGGWLDADTYLVPGSVRAAMLAAGATLQAALAVGTGAAEVAFAVVRPPGHHASRGAGSGFCLVNNVAVAVAGLRGRGVADRIAIVDFDVHHGNGTQAIFDADPDVCYTSTHEFPFYPGTGARSETGTGPGAGTKHNVPLPARSGNAAFVSAWRDELLPAIEAFAPEAILVSAGYDAHVDDPLAALEVTVEGFQAVAEMLGALSTRLALPGVALTLEGGYDLEALRASAAATVRGILAGRRAATPDEA